MKLFYWSSERFQSYLSGSIIVMASNIKQAREKAEKVYLQRYSIDDNDEYNKFMYDISLTPLIIYENVIFEYGSS